MDIELTQEESEAVQKALRSYLSELRMEITDTDNPEYKRELRDERSNLESAVVKLGGGSASSTEADRPSNALSSSAEEATMPALRVVRLWWTSGPG